MSLLMSSYKIDIIWMHVICMTTDQLLSVLLFSLYLRVGKIVPEILRVLANLTRNSESRILKGTSQSLEF